MIEALGAGRMKESKKEVSCVPEREQLFADVAPKHARLGGSLRHVQFMGISEQPPEKLKYMYLSLSFTLRATSCTATQCHDERNKSYTINYRRMWYYEKITNDQTCYQGDDASHTADYTIFCTAFILARP